MSDNNINFDVVFDTFYPDISKEKRELISSLYSSIYKKEEDMSFNDDRLLMTVVFDSVIYSSLKTERLEEDIIFKFDILRRGNIMDDNQEDDNYSYELLSLTTALSFFEGINKPLCRHDPSFSLLNDLFEATFKKIIGYTKMMKLSLYNDAYVSWRTIHESESTLLLLVENGDETKDTYVKHIAYSNMYYNPELFPEELRNDVFENQIKKEMASHDLKSKDMKKFLEYGWLYSCKEYDKNKYPKFKLNFNDGVDTLAGFRDEYNEFYRGTSEISHSSSIFFYANEETIMDIATMLVFESSSRIFKLYYKYMEEYFSRNKESSIKAFRILKEIEDIAISLRKRYEEE